MTPRLRADFVLFDIDRTVVETHVPGEVFLDALYRLAAEQWHVTADEARRRVLEMFDPAEQDPEAYLPQLGIEPQTYRRRVFDLIRDQTTVYPDAVALIRWLMDRGFRLYPATTNGPTAIIVKLAVAGLADLNGVTCFTELFGGSTVCPGGKSGPGFFHALMTRIDAAPDDILMVGDDPQRDLEDAQEAGIRQVVLVDRAQTADRLMPDPPALRVRKLTEIIPFLERRDA